MASTIFHDDSGRPFKTRPSVCWYKKMIYRDLRSRDILRKMRFIHNFDRTLKEKLQRKGFDIIGQFSCRGYDTSKAAMIVGGINNDRPNARDLKRAEDFARGLKDG